MSSAERVLAMSVSAITLVYGVHWQSAPGQSPWRPVARRTCRPSEEQSTLSVSYNNALA